MHSRKHTQVRIANRLCHFIYPTTFSYSIALHYSRSVGKKQAASLVWQRRLLFWCYYGTVDLKFLLEKSFEYGEHVGLGLIPGEIVGIEGQLTDPELKVPQMGWNALQYPSERAKSRLYQGVAEGEFVYFVHSFCAVGSGDCLSAYVDYSFPVTASVEKENVYGVQYHPEKSGETGLKILKNFCTL